MQRDTPSECPRCGSANVTTLERQGYCRECFTVFELGQPGYFWVLILLVIAAILRYG